MMAQYVILVATLATLFMCGLLAIFWPQKIAAPIARPGGAIMAPGKKKTLSRNTRMGLIGAHIDNAGGISGKRR